MYIFLIKQIEETYTVFSFCSYSRFVSRIGNYISYPFYHFIISDKEMHSLWNSGTILLLLIRINQNPSMNK